MFCIADIAWGPESFSLPNAGKRNELCPCFYQCWRHNVAHIVRISHYSQWPQENNRNSKKTRMWQDLCLTLHLQRGEQIERDYRHQTRSATLVALSPLPPKTEQSIEPVQRNRQRGEWGLSMITLEGQWWVKNASLVLIIKPLLSRSSLFPKKKKWERAEITVPANDRAFYLSLSERNDRWNWFAWKWNTDTFISRVC